MESFSKRIFAVSLTLFLVFVLVGCGGSSGDGNIVETSYELTLNIVGNGTVDIDPDKDEYEKDEVVTLTASPLTVDDGFAYWNGSGFDGNRSKEITITMTDDVMLYALFGVNTDFVEDFSNNDNGWNEGTSDSGQVWGFTADNKYSMTLNSENYNMWSSPDELICHDFEASVEFDISTENYKSAGFRFNASQDGSDYYIIKVDTYGDYIITRNSNDNWTIIQGWTPASGYIDTDINEISVFKTGNTYSFTLNGQPLDEVEVEYNYPSLDLLASAAGTVPVTVIFDNYNGIYLSEPSSTSTSLPNIKVSNTNINKMDSYNTINK